MFAISRNLSPSCGTPTRAAISQKFAKSFCLCHATSYSLTSQRPVDVSRVFRGLRVVALAQLAVRSQGVYAGGMRTLLNLPDALTVKCVATREIRHSKFILKRMYVSDCWLEVIKLEVRTGRDVEVARLECGRESGSLGGSSPRSVSTVSGGSEGGLSLRLAAIEVTLASVSG